MVRVAAKDVEPVANWDGGEAVGEAVEVIEFDFVSSVQSDSVAMAMDDAEVTEAVGIESMSADSFDWDFIADMVSITIPVADDVTAAIAAWGIAEAEADSSQSDLEGYGY
jgi:hypothetical protein